MSANNSTKNIIQSFKVTKIIFPVHPRTKKNLDKLKFHCANLITLEPLSYFDFMFFLKNSKCVITDSGGITEEATFFKIPCLTLRNTTERPETIHSGTNVLVSNNHKKLIKYANLINSNKWKKNNMPEFWDGKASKRILDVLLKLSKIDTV